MQDRTSIINEINQLKKEKNAVILAHNYQRKEIQDIADFLGDSLGLSQEAVNQDADVIVFCGVDFMAESAAILSPEKTVLLPEKEAECPMAAMVDVDSLRQKKKEHPNAAVVCYVNTSAAVKAECDICCTSSNAVNIINSLKENDIIFVPDKNLAKYVSLNSTKNIIPWEGYCPTHHQILVGDILLMKEEHPNAEIIAHPECKEDVLDISDKVLSTTGMTNYAKSTNSKEMIIATETGILYRLKKENPDKIFYSGSEYAVCPNMKMTTLEGVLDSLKNMKHVISVPEEIRIKAMKSLERMLEVGRT
ncbi:quinolinate synthase NadA [Methanosalsum natronophilum]|uniref:Quinolinate synthase n=1 Tax=Methanosalsum natronophilum TaxID=768733 RepID=A0A424Z4H8_9EURY|nr:quinolinate synthase NadA [Methanosalsum natronophilum]MCS3923128.1 quinolinate synthase [Methanosalsum natronophilum]RQD92479.1 MAG: quinolinate synthase NadA [Methanosalsum natronophilum]